ncbi:hypothetical protein [Acinetobacter ursingii]|uniref:hypothetical protein n=1 Tax=Acinetobacter ursingii TaxID=108980 RepID=UPI00300AB46D
MNASNDKEKMKWRKEMVERLIFENKTEAYNAIDQVIDLEKFYSGESPVIFYPKNDEQKKAINDLIESFN